MRCTRLAKRWRFKMGQRFTQGTTSDNESRDDTYSLGRILATAEVDSAAYHIKYAANVLRGLALYREHVEIMTAALRELQEVVIQGTERGARAALLKPHPTPGSIIQQGEDATAAFLRPSRKTGGLV